MRHDGQVISGEMLPDGEGESAFLCEFAAQLDVVSEEPCRRLLVMFDCTSPVEALFAFLRTHDRQKIDKYQDSWYDTWLQRLQEFEVVVFLHVHSHEGCVVSEYVDQLAKAAVTQDYRRVFRVACRRHVSLSFKRENGGKDGESAARAGKRLVVERLRACSVDSIFPDADDTVCRPGGCCRVSTSWP